MEQRDYETNAGEKRTVFEVVADEIGPSLRWATAQVERTERSGGFGAEAPKASHQQHLIRCTATKSRSDFTRTSVVSRHLSRRTKNNGEKPPPDSATDAAPRKFKKKTSPLVIGKVEYVDYKDVDLLSRFMSDRGKIRGQRINGNDVQQQRRWQTPSRLHEMGLLPYARRVASASRGRPSRRWPPT